jgi:hypothetical protein
MRRDMRICVVTPPMPESDGRGPDPRDRSWRRLMSAIDQRTHLRDRTHDGIAARV